jgi:signal transduction histidine kinase
MARLAALLNPADLAFGAVLVWVALATACGFHGYPRQLNQAALLLALFTVATRHSRIRTVAAAAVVYAELLYSDIHEWVGSMLWIYLGSAMWVAAVAVVGDGARRLRESRVLLAEYQEHLQRKQADREQRAVLMERIRIARELHDVTAHHLSVIAVQAGVARFVLDTEPETADQALRAISEVGSEGLAELRRLISLLRPEDEEAVGSPQTPAPGVAQLPVLIERVGLSGTPSRYTVAGRQRPLPAGIELCLYRVVQESLTNVLKHAPGSSVEVRLEYEATVVRVSVADTGAHSSDSLSALDSLGPLGSLTGALGSRTPILPAAVTQAARHSGSGVGLTGMRERAALYGGELSAGRNVDGGFEVSLTLPIDGVDADDADPALAIAGVGGR